MNPNIVNLNIANLGAANPSAMNLGGANLLAKNLALGANLLAGKAANLNVKNASSAANPSVAANLRNKNTANAAFGANLRPAAAANPAFTSAANTAANLANPSNPAAANPTNPLNLAAQSSKSHENPKKPRAGFGDFSLPNLEDFFVSSARQGVFAHHADIIFGKYFIYLLTPQNALLPCVLWRYFAGEREISKKPLVHFCPCRDLEAVFAREGRFFKAKTTKNHLFDFQISRDAMFYGVKLPLCGACAANLGAISPHFGGEQPLEYWEYWESWDLLFKNAEILRQERLALEANLAVSADFAAMNLCEKEGNFYLKRVKNGAGW